METKASGKTFSWFYEDGPENDVIISTRARIVRNLADFKFPSKMSEDDVRRVVSLAEDAFNYDENFQFVRASELSKTGLQVLRDNTMIGNNNFQAFAMNNKEAVICLVNELNHLKIINFDCGFDPEKVMKNVYKVDENLQKKLQFAASYEFGYLTSQIKDCGTGLRISIRIFIPSIVLSGRFPDFSKKLAEQKFCLRPIVKPGNNTDFSNFFFDVYYGDCQEGTELDQLAQIQSLGTYIFKTERKIRREFADNNPTVVLNFVKSNFAKAVNSLLITYEEALNYIGVIKWGLQTGVLTGVSESDVNGLMYTTKYIHLQIVNDNYPFTFEDDIKGSQELVIQRLRATVIQQTLENARLQ